MDDGDGSHASLSQATETPTAEPSSANFSSASMTVQPLASIRWTSAFKKRRRTSGVAQRTSGGYSRVQVPCDFSSDQSSASPPEIHLKRVMSRRSFASSHVCRSRNCRRALSRAGWLAVPRRLQSAGSSASVQLATPDFGLRGAGAAGGEGDRRRSWMSGLTSGRSTTIGVG